MIFTHFRKNMLTMGLKLCDGCDRWMHTVLGNSDQAQSSLNRSFSTAQHLAPELPRQAAPHASSSSAALPLDVAVVLFCYNRCAATSTDDLMCVLMLAG